MSGGVRSLWPRHLGGSCPPDYCGGGGTPCKGAGVFQPLLCGGNIFRFKKDVDEAVGSRSWSTGHESVRGGLHACMNLLGHKA